MAASVIVTVVSIIASASSKILADEFNAWSPRLTRKLVAYAVRRLLESKQERYREEWSSYLEEIPGEIGKIFAAFGLVLAGIRIGYAQQKETQRVNVLSGKTVNKNLRDALQKVYLLIWTVQPFAEFAALLFVVTRVIMAYLLHHMIHIPLLLDSVIGGLAVASLLFMKSDIYRARMSIRKLIFVSNI